MSWREILLDIWRLGCLEQVAEGRTAGLYRVGAMKDYLESCIPFCERLESVLRQMVEEEDSNDITINPEVVPESIRPIGCDFLIGKKLLKISGEKHPDMYSWTEAWLTAYLFVSCGYCKPIEHIQILNPFYGNIWTFSYIDLLKAKRLYEKLIEIWNTKNA